MYKPSADVAESQASHLLPGLHIVADLQSSDASLLNTYTQFRAFILSEISHLELSHLGETFHNFNGGGFTAVICLSESHLSIHTWPERAYLTFDVFLSNHKKNNRDIARLLYSHVTTFFKAEVLREHFIDR